MRLWNPVGAGSVHLIIFPLTCLQSLKAGCISAGQHLFTAVISWFNDAHICQCARAIFCSSFIWSHFTYLLTYLVCVMEKDHNVTSCCTSPCLTGATQISWMGCEEEDERTLWNVPKPQWKPLRWMGLILIMVRWKSPLTPQKEITYTSL